MNVTDIKDKRRRLEEEICEKLNAFQAETGTTVEGLSIQQIHCMGSENFITKVRIDVKL